MNEKVLGKSRLSKKYQLTIPKTVRVLLCLAAGDTVEFVLERDKIYIRKSTE